MGLEYISPTSTAPCSCDQPGEETDGPHVEDSRLSHFVEPSRPDEKHFIGSLAQNLDSCWGLTNQFPGHKKHPLWRFYIWGNGRIKFWFNFNLRFDSVGQRRDKLLDLIVDICYRELWTSTSNWLLWLILRNFWYLPPLTFPEEEFRSWHIITRQLFEVYMNFNLPVVLCIWTRFNLGQFQNCNMIGHKLAFSSLLLTYSDPRNQNLLWYSRSKPTRRKERQIIRPFEMKLVQFWRIMTRTWGASRTKIVLMITAAKKTRRRALWKIASCLPVDTSYHPI